MRKDGFYMPARVLCGDDAVRKYAGEMKKFGKKALIVTQEQAYNGFGNKCVTKTEQAGV